jgi:DNA repair exonuclease SbcCD ATPase subunit
VDQKQQTILEQKEISSKLSELEEERSSLITKIESIRDCLHEVQRKKVQETARSIDQLREESLLVDKKLTSLEDSLEKMSTLKQQSASLQARLEETDLQIEEKQRLVLDQEKQLKQMRSDTTDLLQTKRSIAELERLLTDIATRMIELQQLVDTCRQNQLELKSLREQETKIKHLYQIFSKELMVMVLQEFLPTLEEVINSYLSQMVEYRILLPLPDEQEERIELAILIEDQFGKRPVKSLS